MSTSQPSRSEEESRPVEPEFRAPQRSRLILSWYEAGEQQSWSGEGWTRVDGPWVHHLSDEEGFWQSWPASAVVCIDWGVPDA